MRCTGGPMFLPFGRRRQRCPNRMFLPLGRRRERCPNRMFLPFGRRRERCPNRMFLPFGRRRERCPNRMFMPFGRRRLRCPNRVPKQRSRAMHGRGRAGSERESLGRCFRFDVTRVTKRCTGGVVYDARAGPCRLGEGELGAGAPDDRGRGGEGGRGK